MISKLQEFRWITKLGPSFLIDGNQVRVFSEPSVFYEQLNTLARSAQRRVVLAALYLGNGHLESQLVESIRTSLCRESVAGLKVHVLLDYTRGSRGGVNSSRAMLSPLIAEYPRAMRVSLYHSPQLRGWFKWLLPERWNEVVGLQHIKLYIFDDHMIISGANMSDQYFRQRQDRYVMFENCPEICDYFEDLVDTVGKFSLQLDKNNDVSTRCELHPYKSPLAEFVEKAKEAVAHLLKPNELSETTESSLDTLVCPLIQMGPFGITHDQQITSRLLESFGAGQRCRMATGYFNLISDYERIITEKSRATFEILTAAPVANSFFQSRGWSYYIPAMYTYFLREFYTRISGGLNRLELVNLPTPTLSATTTTPSSSNTNCSSMDTEASMQNNGGGRFSTTTTTMMISVVDGDDDHRVRLFEYVRPQWTFHGKGLWLWRKADDPYPYATLVGSPNFGYRSVERDLEAQVLIVTENQKLQRQLNTEQARLFDGAEMVTMETLDAPDRRIPWIVRLFAPLVRSLF